MLNEKEFVIGNICIFLHFSEVYIFLLGVCAKDNECKSYDDPILLKPNLEKFFFDLENTIRDLVMPQETRNDLQEEKTIHF